MSNSATISDFVSHLTERAAILGDFNLVHYGYGQDINAIPDLQYPVLFMLPGSPDMTIPQEGIVKGVPYTNYTMKFLAWDMYDSAEQKATALEDKYVELQIKAMRLLTDTFSLISDNVDFRFKLLPTAQAAVMQSKAKHNDELAEVQITLTGIRLFLGEV